MATVNVDQIYAEYGGKIMGYIRARIRGKADAEDLFSEVFERIIKKLDDFDPEKASLNTWIFTITRNIVIDHFRRTKPSSELDENLTDGTELDEDLLNTESLSELASALRSLPQQMMDIIVLRYYDGKPLTEIAELMGLSYGAVKLRHQNALLMLRKALQDRV
ncbi:MAG: sigma-70 family RNA polymerase sigma factor [Clostridia bacterium]|jgi:RNA polymerase sigma-70 factor (ECF subfamily)|nr:sigma-70 family RNA polymerase sigma factor [Clostridia bacterium]